MATVGIMQNTAHLKRLVDILVSRLDLNTYPQRMHLLEASGLSFFASTLDFSGDARQFAQTLIRRAEQRGKLPNQDYPSLVNLLYHLRDDVLGDDEDHRFVVELLTPYAAPPSTVESSALGVIPPQPPVPSHHTILFLAANPAEYPPLSLADEVRIIGERLREGNVRDRFRLESEWALRRNDLSERLLRHKPTMVHFAGHGESDRGVVVADDTGNAATLAPAAFAGLLWIVRESVAPHLNLVLFNICWSQPQAEALKAIGVSHVIGMQREIPDKAARAFAAGFYRGIGFGLAVPQAFALGCNEIELDYPAQPELAKIPQLL